MSLGPGFRYEREKDEGEWLTEYRYWVHFTFKHDVGEWETKFRTKIELRDLEDDDVWRIRPKLKVQRPLSIASVDIVPFLSEEPFYDFSEGEWNQNRAAAGVSIEFGTHAELGIYHMNVAKRSDDGWNTTHVVGTEVVYSF